MNLSQSWIENTLKGGLTLTYSEDGNGLAISGTETSYGWEGRTPQSGALTLINWTKIKYTQEVRGVTSCWSIFGDDK